MRLSKRRLATFGTILCIVTTAHLPFVKAILSSETLNAALDRAGIPHALQESAVSSFPRPQVTRIDYTGASSPNHPSNRLARRQLEGTNINDPNSNSSRYYAELSKPSGGLWIWTNIARMTRQSMRYGATSLPLPPYDSNSSSSFDAMAYLKTFAMYAIPLLCFLGSLLLTCFSSCLTGCCLCTCRKKQLGRRQKDPFTTRQRTVASIFFIFVIFCWTAAIICGIRGTEFMHRTVQIFAEVGNGTFTDTQSTVAALQVSVGDTFTALNAAVLNVSTEAKKVVDLNALTPIGTTIVTLASNLTILNGFKNQLVAEASVIDNYKQILVNPTNGLVTGLLSTISNANTVLNTQTSSANAVTGYPAYTYQWAQAPISVDASDLSAKRTSVAGTTSVPNTVNSAVSGLPPLSAIAAEATGVGNNLTNMVTDLLNTKVTGIQTDVATQLTSVKADVDVTFNDMHSKVEEFREKALEYIGLMEKYELYRRIAFPIIFGLPAIILLFMMGGVAGRRPGLVKGCLCASIPYTLVALLLCFLLTFTAWLLGEVCHSAFDKSNGSPTPLISFMTNVTGSDYVLKMMDAQTGCLQGATIVNTVKLFVDLPDITSAADDQVNRVNFTQIAQSINPSDIIGTIQSPSGAASAAQSASTAINGIDMTPLNQIDSSLANLATALNAVINQMQGSSGVNDAYGFKKFLAADVTLSPGGSPAAAQDAAAADCEAALVPTRQQLVQARDVIIPNARNNGALLLTHFTNLTSIVNSLVNGATDIPPAFTSLTTMITSYVNAQAAALTTNGPGLTASLSLKVNAAAAHFTHSNVSCKAIADRTMDVEIALCEGIQGGLDAIWFGFFVLGTVGGMSVPIFIGAANKLADRTATKSQSDKKKKRGGKIETAAKSDKGVEKKATKDVEAGQIKWTSPNVANTSMKVVKTSDLSPTEQSSYPQLPAPDQNLYPSVPSPQYEQYTGAPSGYRDSTNQGRQSVSSEHPGSRRYSEVGGSQRPTSSYMGGDVEVLSPAFSPRLHHPNVPLMSQNSGYGSYYQQDGGARHNPGYISQSPSSNDGRLSHYDDVLGELSNRISYSPPPNPVRYDNYYAGGAGASYRGPSHR
ncbi:hypothetical protein DFS34DRAFT_601458 [Phlyctochytrium arcticum]|nr:hypothetical protein DFS34DRAFT_601458 [Phlyctochytrium arcticum]